MARAIWSGSLSFGLVTLARLDYTQNDVNKALVAPYSPRPVDHQHPPGPAGGAGGPFPRPASSSVAVVEFTGDILPGTRGNAQKNPKRHGLDSRLPIIFGSDSGIEISRNYHQYIRYHLESQFSRSPSLGGATHARARGHCDVLPPT